MLEEIKNRIEFYVKRLVLCNDYPCSQEKFTENDRNMALTGSRFLLDGVDLYQLCDVIEKEYHILLPSEALAKNEVLTINSLSGIVFDLVSSNKNDTD